MAGDWIPVDVTLPRKIEVLQIAQDTGLTRFEVAGRLFEFWGWVQSVTELSRLGCDIRNASVALGFDESFLQAVARAGWLIETDDGLEIPNADQWLGRGAKARLQNTKRQKRLRECRAKHNAASATEARPQNRTEQYKKPPKSPAASAGDLPTLERTKTGAWQRWVAAGRQTDEALAAQWDKITRERWTDDEVIASVENTLARNGKSLRRPKRTDNGQPDPAQVADRERIRDETRAGKIVTNGRKAGLNDEEIKRQLQVAGLPWPG